MIDYEDKGTQRYFRQLLNTRMKRSFSKIALPEFHQPQQLSLLAGQIPQSAKDLYAPFPQVYRYLDALPLVLANCAAHSPGLIGLDMEYDTERDNKPSILGLSGLHHALSVPWSEECVGAIQTCIDRGLKLVAYSTMSADKPCIDPYIKTKREDWLDAMLSHYLAHQDLCKRPSKEEDDDPGALGFMNLWCATSLVVDVPNWKRCRGLDCFGPCASCSVFDYNAADSWAGLVIEMENSRQLDSMGVPASLRTEMLELSDLCAEMERQGIGVDRQVVSALDAELKARKEALFLENQPFNPKSPKTVVAWFKEQARFWKMPELAVEKNDKESVQDAVITLGKRYLVEGEKPAEIVEGIRDVAELPEPVRIMCDLHDHKAGGKGLKAWFDARYFGRDGRLHPRSIVTGTSTGRLSMSRPNFQNVPKLGWGKKVRAAVTARPGYQILRADFKQVELRTVLYLAGVDPKDIGKDAFTWLVGQSNGAFTRAAAMTSKSEREIAKRISHACVTGDHEVLTRFGWKKIATLNGSEEVAQWDNWKISFVKPKRFWSYPKSVPLTKLMGRGVSVICTENHQFPTITRGNWKHKRYEILRKRCLVDAPKSSNIPVVGFLSSSGLDILDDEIRQAVAIQADGTLTGKKARFHFVRPRKIKRLCQIFPGVQTKPCADHPNGIQASVVVSHGVKKILDDGKNFRISALLQLSREQREIFLSEILLWDGSRLKKSNVYCNTSYEDCVAVQLMSHLSGRQALLREEVGSSRGNHKTLWKVSFNRRKFFSLENCSTEIVGSEDVFCLTVPSSYFLVRHQDRISVTGNSDYGEGIQVLTADDLDSARTKAAEAAGALVIYRDWEYAGGVIAFTGVNLAEALFGDKSWESRAKALAIQEKVYFANFPAIRKWQRQVLAEVEARGYIKYPTGRFLRLSGSSWDEESRPQAMTEDAKIAFAALGSGVSADHVQAVMLNFWRDYHGKAVPLLQVHDELLFEVLLTWSRERCADFLHPMIEETWRLPGFSAPVDAGLGASWLEAMEAAEDPERRLVV